MKLEEILFVASKYRVAAFRKSNGDPLWETILITSFFKIGGSFVTLAIDDSGVYAHVANELFRLDLITGRIVWQKKVPNLGRDVASLALPSSGAVSSTSSSYARIIEQRRTESSSSDTTASA